ncbi:MAG: class I SAM-dependent methyltransferase [Chloroflexota bacterium]
MRKDTHRQLVEALWRIYRRPSRPQPWAQGGNLPWDDPAFSERMLREHLDESHGAASRVAAERALQLDWLWEKLALRPGARLLDVTCGPGLYAVELARRGVQVTGVDFSPAAIRYARQLAVDQDVAGRCLFAEQDVRQMAYAGADFDAALLLYGQLAVFPRQEARELLAQVAQALRPGGRLCLELLHQDKVDKKDSAWWFTDDTGLWGDAPFLHLGERFWLASEDLSIERYFILSLDSGQLSAIHLCDQTYSVAAMTALLKAAGFGRVTVYENWDGLPLYDAGEWAVYVAEREGTNTSPRPTRARG